MSDIEWSPWVKGDPEPFARFSGIQVDGQCYRIPMPDYKRITGMPEWSEAPEWAQWMAQGEDGLWCGFSVKPESCQRNNRWFIKTHVTVEAFGTGTVLGDWRDTLQERPRDPLDTHPNSELDADQYTVGGDTVDAALDVCEKRGLNPYDAAGFLDSALGHMRDRESTYDANGGERSMGKTVAAFNAVTGRDLSEEQGWLFMVLLKAVRTQQGGFRADNYEDGAAYFGLQGEAAHRDRS